MPKRVQSPSSINVYRSCQRKYYYQYIKKFQTLPSIHTVRGTVAHTVLENFFEIDVTGVTKANAREVLSKQIPSLLLKHWAEAKEEFEELDMTESQIRFFFEETLMMLFNWLNHFLERVQKYPGDFQAAFKAFTPIREKEYKSTYYSVRGFIDAIEHAEDMVSIIDYKTSKRPIMTPDYKLQLAIYSLLYQEVHNKMPEKVGIFFLKDRAQFINVDHDLIEFAKREIETIHLGTESENIADYPKDPSQKWCKWCEFAELCGFSPNDKSRKFNEKGMPRRE
jgi:putative RecB family exonuclease